MCPLILVFSLSGSFILVSLFFSWVMLLSWDAWLNLLGLTTFYSVFPIPEKSLNFAGDKVLCWGIWVCLRAGVIDVIIAGCCCWMAGCWTAGWTDDCWIVDGCWEDIFLIYLGASLPLVLCISAWSNSPRCLALILSWIFFLKHKDKIFFISSLLMSLIFPFIRLVTISV